MKAFWLSVAALGGLSVLPLIAQETRGDKPAVEQARRSEPYKVGETVEADIVLKDIDGKEIKLKDLRGKVVFIHFWSMNCPYEKVADPKVDALTKKWADKDVVVLAIDANSNEIGEAPPADLKAYDKIREHLAEKKISMRVFADYGNKVADMFNAQSTPHCFVINPKGVLVYAGGLDDDPKGDKGESAKLYVRDAVEATLAGEAVKVTTSKHYGCSIKRVSSGS